MLMLAYIVSAIINLHLVRTWNKTSRHHGSGQFGAIQASIIILSGPIGSGVVMIFGTPLYIQNKKSDWGIQKKIEKLIAYH